MTVTLRTSRSLASRAVHALGGGLLALAAFLGTVLPAAAEVPAAVDYARSFVSTRGTEFTLAGEPFRFVGSNMYNAAGDPAIYECGPYMADPERELDDWFRRARAEFSGQVIRFWAFQSYTNGGTDWRAFDRVFRLANAHGLKVIPVLENQWRECTEGDYKLDAWYAGGYTRPYGRYPLSYRDYVERVVTRYAHEPAIAAWMLMNEAEAKSAAGSANPDALFRFAADVSGLVKRLDPNHLVTLGVMGSGQPGVAGSSFERLHALETIDFLEYHDYGRNDEPLPGGEALPTVPLTVSLYTQDQNWGWVGARHQALRSRTWETLTTALPAGAAYPLRRIGFQLTGDYAGDVYVDRIEISGRVYDFEGGTTQGWRTSEGDGTASVSAGTGPAYSGSRALRVTRERSDRGTEIWISALPEDAAGAAVTVRVYVDAPGQARHVDTLASALVVAKELNKPLLVGESGMTTCGPLPGWQPETADSRARKLDAKMESFFASGGAGYLVWTWNPRTACDHDFTSGDPLNGVLSSYAARLRGS